MLHYSVVFLIIVLFAGLLGSTGIAVSSVVILAFSLPLLLIILHIVEMIHQK